MQIRRKIFRGGEGEVVKGGVGDDGGGGDEVWLSKGVK
jgi:hypothetical protein